MIFENERVELLCLRFKRNGDFATLHRICDHLTNLMASIIKKSRYHMTVPFPDLMAYLYNQIDRWALKWKPGQGKFYTYACSSIKHGCLSCIARETTFHQRHQSVGDVPLEALGGSTDTRNSHGLSEQIAADLANVHTRWHEPEIREATRVILDNLLRHRGEARPKGIDGRSFDSRKALIRTLQLGYDIPADQAKFLIDWTRGAVRAATIGHFKSPLSEADIIRLYNKYSFLPDLVNVVGVDMTKRLLHVFSGISIRFPTMTQMRRHRSNCVTVSALMDGSDEDDLELTPAIDELVQRAGGGILEDAPLYSEDELANFDLESRIG